MRNKKLIPFEGIEKSWRRRAGSGRRGTAALHCAD